MEIYSCIVVVVDLHGIVEILRYSCRVGIFLFELIYFWELEYCLIYNDVQVFIVTCTGLL